MPTTNECYLYLHAKLCCKSFFVISCTEYRRLTLFAQIKIITEHVVFMIDMLVQIG